MSLWTPYTTEEVLDLSSKATTVKVELSEKHHDHHEPPLAASPGSWGEPRLPLQPVVAHTYLTTCRPVHVQTIHTAPPPYPSPDTSLYSEHYCQSPQVSPGWSVGSKSPNDTLNRPFKVATSSIPVGEDCAAVTDPDFLSFRENMLSIMRARNGGSQCVSNPRMRRAVRRSNDCPNAEYLERRERNNAAAKRSRDLRKMREDELAIRAAYLERCNDKLKAQLDAANAELAILRARF